MKKAVTHYLVVVMELDSKVMLYWIHFISFIFLTIVIIVA